MSARVFLLEDDINVTEMVRDTVERTDWRFQSMFRVEGVLEAMRQFKPDIVLLDVQLPDGDGYQVCGEIRKDPALMKAPVIFLTVRGELENRLKGFAAGGLDYVVKPFSVDELRARIRAHLAVKEEMDALTREKEDLALRTRVRQDMFDMIVHDLRAPISVISMTIDMVRNAGLITDSKIAHFLRNADDAAKFTLVMVGDILDLDAGKPKVEPKPLNLKELAERLKGFFSLKLASREVEFRCELPPQEREFTTDSFLLLRVLINLLANALKFSRSGDAIEFKARHTPAGLRLEMADQGPGIPDPEKKRIFVKYYRVDATESMDTPGTGIGLAFCKLACEALGGRIWVEDAPGKGTRFVVELPNLDPAAPGTKPASAASGALFTPEILKGYLDNCRVKITRARELALELKGPGGAEALKNLKGIVHQLAGSAGTYGYTKAGETAMCLESLLNALPDGTAPSGREAEKLREQVLSFADSLRVEFGETENEKS